MRGTESPSVRLNVMPKPSMALFSAPWITP